jgi:putative DNA primase/helicase
MDSTGVFKMLTGGDAISGEKKFKDGYSFINFARLVFSANKPPRILDEDSYAFWRRWIIINLPNQFPEDDPKTDPEILAKLTTESELSGFLNLALDGLQRLLINGKFSYHKTVDQTQSYYLRASDPVYAFVEDCCELDPDAITSKDELFDAFKNYCRENRTPLINRDSFAKALKNNPHFRVTPTRPLIDGERVHYWKGVKLLNRVSPVSPLDPFKGCVRRPVNGINKSGSNVNKDKSEKPDRADRADQKDPWDNFLEEIECDSNG